MTHFECSKFSQFYSNQMQSTWWNCSSITSFFYSIKFHFEKFWRTRKKHTILRRLAYKLWWSQFRVIWINLHGLFGTMTYRYWLNANRSNPDVLFHKIPPAFSFIVNSFRCVFFSWFISLSYVVEIRSYLFHFRCVCVCLVTRWTFHISYFWNGSGFVLFSNVYAFDCNFLSLNLYIGFNRLAKESAIILLQCG